MKVILISRIKALGNIGDIKVVADGYGKNYLIPRKAAIMYSEKNYKVFEDKKRAIEEDDLVNRETALIIKEKIEKKNIVLIENAGDSEKLYGSITSSKVANFVNNLIGEKFLTKNNVVIKEPIKTLGKFKILFELHSDVLVEKDVIVARTKEEAEKIRASGSAKKGDKVVTDGEKTAKTEESVEEKKAEKPKSTGKHKKEE
jgi:large subunit ribosomal protein L9